MPSYAGGQLKHADYLDEEFRMINDTEILAWVSDPERIVIGNGSQ